jgi:hypothetical protein
MQKLILRSSLLIVVAALAVAFLVPQAQAKGKNVTFVNETDSTRYVLAAWGEGSCAEKTQTEAFTLEAGAEHELDTDGQRACYCVGRSAKVASCGAWQMAGPKKTERIEH